VLAAVSYLATVPITVLFPWIVIVAVIAGVIDITLFVACRNRRISQLLTFQC